MKCKSPIAQEYFQSFYQGNHLLYAAVMLLTILNTPANLIASWMLGEVLDIITAGSLERLWRMLRIALLFCVIITLLDLFMYRCKAVFIRRALERYKAFAFRRLSEKSISAFSRENTGRYVSVLTNDVSSVEENYLNRSFLLVYHSLLFLGALGMMFYYSWKLALATILLSCLPMAVSLCLGKRLSVLEKAVSDQNEDFVAKIKDLLSGFSVIKSFKAEKEAQTLFDQENRNLESAKCRRRWWEGVLSAMGGSLCGVIVQFGIFLYGAYLAITGSITAGTVLIMVNLCNFVLEPIRTVPQYLASRKAAAALVEKLAQITGENASRTGAVIAPTLNDAIILDHLTFGYEPNQPVLQDISLRFEAGKKYALVGASGSGKTTLLNLLMGAWDSYTGALCIDGRELRDIEPDSLYDLLSLIGQNVFLFDDTVRRNITMFRDFPKDQVDLAVKRAGLSRLLEERGEDYLCGENGGGLSGGERQRISIARCLLRGTPVLLLDEATAALDHQTAFEVTDAILHLDGLTRLVVTHRLEPALLNQYDEIIVLRGGRVSERGTFQELMERKGCFYSLYTLSAG